MLEITNSQPPKLFARDFLSGLPWAFLLAAMWPLSSITSFLGSSMFFGIWLFSFYSWERKRALLSALVGNLVVGIALVQLLKTQLGQQPLFAVVYSIITLGLFVVIWRWMLSSAPMEAGTLAAGKAAGFTGNSLQQFSRNKVVRILLLAMIVGLTAATLGRRWAYLWSTQIKDLLDLASVILILAFVFYGAYVAMGKNSRVIKGMVGMFVIAAVIMGLVTALIFFAEGLLWFQ